MVAARLLKDLTKLAIIEQRREAGKAGGGKHIKGKTLTTSSGSATVADPPGKKGKKAKKDNRVAVAKQANVSERKVRIAALESVKRTFSLLKDLASARSDS